MQKVIGVVLACTMLFSTVGCVPVATQIATDGSAVASALLSIAAIEQTTDPAAAANIITAANALKAATANFTTGSSMADINSAAQVAEVVLSTIPSTAAIAPLIPIAVAALDVLLANIQTTPATLDDLKVGEAPNVVKPTINPYRGRAVIKHRVFRSLEGDFTAAWNEVVKNNPKLASAQIK